MGMPAGKMPTNADRLGRKLNGMRLPTAKELFSSAGLSPKDGKEALKYLVNEELSEGFEVGAMGRGVKRYRNRKEGLIAFGASGEEASWHGDDAVGVLLQYDMPKIEALNVVAAQYAKGGWKIAGFHCVERSPMYAAVEFSVPGDDRSTYLVVCWASAMDTESELVYRLEMVPVYMREQGVIRWGTEFYPAGLAVVGTSEWIVARALTMACAVLDQWVLRSCITGWYHSQEGWRMSDGLSVSTGARPEGSPKLLPPVSQMRPRASVRKLGGKKFDRLVRRLLWSGRAGQKLVELLTLMGDFPVGSVGQYKAFVGEGPDGDTTKERLAILQKLGLVEVAAKKARARAEKRLPRGVPLTISARGQGADRYKLTVKGCSVYCLFHGGRPSDLPKRTKLGRLQTEVREKRQNGDIRKRHEMPVIGVEDRWPYRHEDIVYDLGAAFRKEGCSFAPGWQARTALANGQGLDPDGKVLLVSPWGLGWWNLEIELSDNSYGALKPRVAKYGSEHRRDADGALFVLPDDRAERNLHLAASEFEPRPMVLTTTLRRLKDHGVLGPGVWSCYGTPVMLAAPGSDPQ